HGAEQRLHPERPRFVGHDGYDEAPELLVAEQLREHPDEHHRGGCLAAVGALEELLEEIGRHALERLAARLAARYVAAQRLTPFAHVPDLDAVLGGTVKRRLGDLRVRDRDAEAGTKRAQLL